MFIADIQHVNSWAAAPLISAYVIRVSEQKFNNGFNVIRSIVMSMFTGMLVQFGSLEIFLISFLARRIFKFYVLNSLETKFKF